MVYMLRLIDIRKHPESPPSDPRYDVIDMGRYGEAAGAADVDRSLTRESVGDWLAREGFSFTAIRQLLSELAEKGSAQVQAPPRIGPRIVRAWFDTALNPLIEFIQLELGLLTRRNWTFSFGSRRLELIQPVKQRFYNANFEQILQMNAELAVNVETHDAAVAALRNAVTELYGALVLSPEFVQHCESLLTPESLVELGVRERSDVFGAYPPADHCNLIAEYVVNGTGELPPHYATAKFWNRHRVVFLEFLDRLPEVREHFASAVQVAEDLASVSRTLDAQLKNLRQELSLRYDVPIMRGDRNKLTA
jgi:hypothetical protein